MEQEKALMTAQEVAAALGVKMCMSHIKSSAKLQRGTKSRGKVNSPRQNKQEVFI